MAQSVPLYDISQPFTTNYEQGPHFNRPIPPLIIPPRHHWQSLLGYPIMHPIGIPACPIMTSKGIALMAQLGFSIFTYKTVSCRAITGHAWPNIAYVDCPAQLQLEDLGKTFQAHEESAAQSSPLAITNSIGNACFDPAETMADIAHAKSALGEGQLLIVSVFGQGETIEEIAQDFAAAATMAETAGAQIIELNLSCPNVTHGLFYKNPVITQAIIERACSAVSIPVIMKVGIFESKKEMAAILTTAAHAGARGICGINTVPVKVVNANGIPFFGATRITSGLSGAPIKSLAEQFVSDARKIITKHNLNLALLATGGITQAQDFQTFLDLGADCALSGTGTMWDPLIAITWQSKQRE